MQVLDELRPGADLRSGRYCSTLASSALMITLMEARIQPLIALFSRQNQSSPGSVQTALASLLPCDTPAIGDFVRAQAEHKTRSVADIERLVQIPPKSELATAMVPTLRLRLAKGTEYENRQGVTFHGFIFACTQ